MSGQIDYPVMLYKKAGTKDDGLPFSYTPAFDSDAVKALTKDGWHLTVSEAMGFIDGKEKLKKTKADGVEES